MSQQLPEGYPPGTTFHEVLCRSCGKRIIWTTSATRAQDALDTHRRWHQQYHDTDVTVATFGRASTRTPPKESMEDDQQ